MRFTKSLVGFVCVRFLSVLILAVAVRNTVLADPFANWLAQHSGVGHDVQSFPNYYEDIDIVLDTSNADPPVLITLDENGPFAPCPLCPESVTGAQDHSSGWEATEENPGNPYGMYGGPCHHEAPFEWIFEPANEHRDDFWQKGTYTTKDVLTHTLSSSTSGGGQFSAIHPGSLSKFINLRNWMTSKVGPFLNGTTDPYEFSTSIDWNHWRDWHTDGQGCDIVENYRDAQKINVQAAITFWPELKRCMVDGAEIASGQWSQLYMAGEAYVVFPYVNLSSPFTGEGSECELESMSTDGGPVTFQCGVEYDPYE